jgi:hypothetical protein
MRPPRLSALSRATTLLGLAAGLTLAACALPTGSSNETYVLASVNDRALPSDYPDPMMPAGQFRVTAGRLSLDDDGTYTGRFTVSCAPSDFSGSTCHVDDPEQDFEGTYSREEEWMDVGGRRYPAEFTNGAVSVRIYVPSYVGYYPEYTLRFTR